MMVQVVFCPALVPAGCSALTRYQRVVSPGALCLGWLHFGPLAITLRLLLKNLTELHQHTLYQCIAHILLFFFTICLYSSLDISAHGRNQSYSTIIFHCWLINSFRLRITQL